MNIHTYSEHNHYMYSYILLTCPKSNFNFAESTEWEGISRNITYGNFNTENPIISDNILLCVVLHNFLFPDNYYFLMRNSLK